MTNNKTKVIAQPSRRTAFARSIVALKVGSHFDNHYPRDAGESDRAYQARRFDYVAREVKRQETSHVSC